jgi:hypothetical protein
MEMLREWTDCDCKKLWSTGNLKEKKRGLPEDPGKMEYIQRWVEGGIYTAVSGRLDIYSGEWKVGYIQRWVEVVSEWADGTDKGTGIWKSEGVARCFKIAQWSNNINIIKIERTHNSLWFPSNKKFVVFWNQILFCFLQINNWAGILCQNKND